MEQCRMPYLLEDARGRQLKHAGEEVESTAVGHTDHYVLNTIWKTNTT